MTITAVTITLRPLDAGDGANDVRLRADAFVRLTQQYLEIVESGTNNKIRLTQQYLEVVHEFGTPPHGPKPKKDPPGHNKNPVDVYAAAAAEFQARRRRTELANVNGVDDLPPPPPPDAQIIDVTRLVITGAGVSIDREE